MRRCGGTVLVQYTLAWCLLYHTVSRAEAVWQHRVDDHVALRLRHAAEEQAAVHRLPQHRHHLQQSW